MNKIVSSLWPLAVLLKSILKYIDYAKRVSLSTQSEEVLDKCKDLFVAFYKALIKIN